MSPFWVSVVLGFVVRVLSWRTLVALRTARASEYAKGSVNLQSLHGDEMQLAFIVWTVGVALADLIDTALLLASGIAVIWFFKQG